MIDMHILCVNIYGKTELNASNEKIRIMKHTISILSLLLSSSHQNQSDKSAYILNDLVMDEEILHTAIWLSLSGGYEYV